MFKSIKRIYNKTVEIQTKITDKLFANDIERTKAKRDLGIISGALASFTLLATKTGLVKHFTPLIIGLILLVGLIIYIFWDLSLEIRRNHISLQSQNKSYQEESDKWQGCLKAIANLPKDITLEDVKKINNLYTAKLKETLAVSEKTLKDLLKKKKPKISPDLAFRIMLFLLTGALICILCSFLNWKSIKSAKIFEGCRRDIVSSPMDGKLAK
ncbi:MAG TPA: hypothetical protein ENI23_02780 [bacterium]|nr:hypothetical protein [bacterium]